MADLTPEERAGLTLQAWWQHGRPKVRQELCDRHDCQATAVPLYALDADRLAELVRERDEAVTLLRAIVGQFTQKGHPGVECRRTDWVRVTTVDQWRAFLGALDREVPK